MLKSCNRAVRILIVGAFCTTAASAAGASIEGGPPDQTMVLSAAGPVNIEPLVLAAAKKIFKLRSPFPFPIKVKIYGSGPAFPKVVWVPAPPSSGIPIPYPGSSMKVRIKIPTGGWSKKYKIKWRSGNISLPKP